MDIVKLTGSIFLVATVIAFLMLEYDNKYYKKVGPPIMAATGTAWILAIIWS